MKAKKNGEKNLWILLNWQETSWRQTDLKEREEGE
jgi:hypothetical protein